MFWEGDHCVKKCGPCLCELEGLGAFATSSTSSERSGVGQPRCPHCGGVHWGQRFDDCPYLKLSTDETASEEQRRNATEWLRLKREETGK